MADIKRLEQALIAADAAGDTEAAAQLAAEIRRQRVAAPAASMTPAPPKKSLLANVAAEALGGFSDLDKLLPGPPIGALVQTMTGIKGPPKEGDFDFHNSSIGRGARFAAPSVLPVGGAATKAGAAINTVTNAASGFLSGMASKYAEDKNLPSWQQALVSMLPVAGVAGLTGATRVALRGTPGSAREMQANIEQMGDLGVTDFSMSQVAPTGNSRIPLIERGTSFAFGGQGPFQALGQKQSAQLKAQAEKIAGGTLDQAETAGTAVWEGLFAEKRGWVDRAKKTERALWSPVDAALERAMVQFDTPANPGVWDDKLLQFVGKTDAVSGSTHAVEVPGIVKALEGIVKQYDDPALAQALGGDKVGAARLLDAIKAKGGRMTYKDFTNLRNELGELQSGSMLAPSERGINARQAARLWSGMLEDYSSLATKYGVDKELGAAREFTKQYHRNSRNFFKTIFGKEAEPTKIIDEIAVGNFQQPAKLRALREALGPQEFGKLQEYVINRMGTPAGSKSGTFSLETFHTNYNSRFAGSARSGNAVADAMFGPKGTATRDGLEAMFAMAEKTKQGSQMLFNTSGTAGSGIAGASIQATIGDLAKSAAQKFGTLGATASAGGAAFGGPGIAGGIVAGAVGTNVVARLFSSPSFARWVARTANQSTARLPAAISVLSQTKMESAEMEEAKQQFIAAYQARAGK